jgi:hypothetical protein
MLLVTYRQSYAPKPVLQPEIIKAAVSESPAQETVS